MEDKKDIRYWLNKYHERGKYNPDVDYKAITVQVNELLKNGDKEKAKDLLSQYGGMINVYYNMAKQAKERNISSKA